MRTRSKNRTPAASFAVRVLSRPIRRALADNLVLLVVVSGCACVRVFVQDAVSGLGVLRVDVMAQLIADGYPFAERGGRMRIESSDAVEKPAPRLDSQHTPPTLAPTSIQLKQSARSGASLPLHSSADARAGVAVFPLLLAALLLLLLLVALTLRGCCGASRHRGCVSASVSLSAVASEQGARAEAQPFAYQAASALP